MGRVLTFTVIRYPPSGFEELAPYVVSIVELREGVRIMAPIRGCQPDEVRVGMEVEIDDSESNRLPVFRPIGVSPSDEKRCS